MIWLAVSVLVIALGAFVATSTIQSRIISDRNRAWRRRRLKAGWFAYVLAMVGGAWLFLASLGAKFHDITDMYRPSIAVPAAIMLVGFVAGTIMILALLPGMSVETTSHVDDPAEVRVLFLAASPTDTLALKLSSELTEIDKSLRAAPNHIQVVYPGRVPASALAEQLLRYDPTVLHFSGHGQPEGALVFEDESGASRAAPPKVIADLFGILKGRLVCIVLSACYSRLQAEELRRYVDCVVGMTRAIGDDDAIRFSSAFYLALGHGKSVRTAFELGCNQIRLGGVVEAGGRRDVMPANASASPSPSDERIPTLLCREGVDPDRVRIACSPRTESVGPLLASRA